MTSREFAKQEPCFMRERDNLSQCRPTVWT